MHQPVRLPPFVHPATLSRSHLFDAGHLPDRAGAIEHGIVGNGWYLRDLSEVLFWRQSNRLVQGDKLWHDGRKRDSSFTCANSFWWYNMVSDADWCITPPRLLC